MQIDKKRIILGFLTMSPYVIALGAQIMFANYLSVEEVGIFASIGIFISLVLAFSNWNGDKYIISKVNITNEQINEVFTFELGFSIVLYLVTFFFLRDYINSYLEIVNSNLFWVAMGFMFCYFPLTRSKAVLEKRLSFFSAYAPIFFANIIALIIGIICVIQGFGFWSMVIWKVSVHLIDVIILLFIAPYIPRIRLILSDTSSLVSYCLPILSGGVIGFIGTNVDKVLVTSLMGTRELGVYWLAFSFSHIPIIFRELIARLLLPILSKQNSDSAKIQIFEKLNGILQLSTVISAIFVTYWIDILFDLMLGEKWAQAVPVFIVLYYAALFKLVGGLCGALLFSAMRTRVAFDTSWINIVLFVPIIFVAIKFGGLIGASFGVLVSCCLLNLIIHETYVRSFCNSGYWHYLGYLTVNILTLYLVSTFLTESSTGVAARIVSTFIGLGIAVITLPINGILKRIFSKPDLTAKDEIAQS